MIDNKQILLIVPIELVPFYYNIYDLRSAILKSIVYFDIVTT